MDQFALGCSTQQAFRRLPLEQFIPAGYMSNGYLPQQNDWNFRPILTRHHISSQATSMDISMVVGSHPPCVGTLTENTCNAPQN